MRLPRRDERGVTAVIVAVLMSAVLVVSAAFAVDLGQQRVVRRDMQAIADVVSLDLARLLNGRTAAAYDKSAFDEARNKSVARNDDALGGELSSGDVSWDFVKRDNDKWVVVGKTSTDVPTAIRVQAGSDIRFAFGGVTGVARGDANRTSVATLEPFVCFSVGANLVDLDTSSNVLVQALETFLGINLLDVSASAVGPSGIASLKQAKVPLVDLAAALDVGTVDALVSSTQPVTVGELLSASAEVLNDKGGLANLEAALLLDALAANAALATPTLLVSDILKVGPGGGTALNADLSVVDLVQVLAYVAGEHAVGVTVPVNVPGLAGMLATVEIIEIPKIACAKPNESPRTEAESAQIRVSATLNLGSATLVTDLLTGLNNTLTSLLTLGGLLSTREERIKPGSLNTSLTLSVTSAQSRAGLKAPDGLRCSDPAGQTAAFDVTTSLASVDLSLDLGYVVQRRTRFTILSPWGAWNDIRTVSDTILGLGANLGDATPSDVDLVYPAPPSEEMPQATKQTALALALQVTTSQENGVAAIVGDLLNPVLNTLVNPLVSTLNAGLLPALRTTLGLLGVELGRTTLKASGRPGCSPRLVG